MGVGSERNFLKASQFERASLPSSVLLGIFLAVTIIMKEEIIIPTQKKEVAEGRILIIKLAKKPIPPIRKREMPIRQIGRAHV